MVVELLDGREHDDGPQSRTDVAKHQRNQRSEEPTGKRADEGNDVQEAGDQPDEQPEGNTEESQPDTRQDSDDQRHEELTSHEPADHPCRLGDHVDDFRTGLLRYQLLGTFFESRQIYQDVEGENGTECQDDEDIETRPGEGSELTQHLLDVLLIEEIGKPLLQGIDRRADSDGQSQPLPQVDQEYSDVLDQLGNLIGEGGQLIPDDRHHEEADEHPETQEQQVRHERAEQTVDVPLLHSIDERTHQIHDCPGQHQRRPQNAQQIQQPQDPGNDQHHAGDAPGRDTQSP